MSGVENYRITEYGSGAQSLHNSLAQGSRRNAVRFYCAPCCRSMASAAARRGDGSGGDAAASGSGERGRATTERQGGSGGGTSERAGGDSLGYLRRTTTTTYSTYSTWGRAAWRRRAAPTTNLCLPRLICYTALQRVRGSGSPPPGGCDTRWGPVLTAHRPVEVGMPLHELTRLGYK